MNPVCETWLPGGRNTILLYIYKEKNQKNLVRYYLADLNIRIIDTCYG